MKVTRYTPMAPGFRALGSLLLASLLLAGCGEDRSPEDASEVRRQEADDTSTMQCEQGYIPFQTRKVNANDLLSEEGRARLSEEEQEQFDFEPRPAINMISMGCTAWSGNTTDEAELQRLYNDELERLQTACGNEVSCATETTCASGFSLTYSCGQSNLDDEGNVKTFSYSPSSSASREVDFACEYNPTTATTEAGEISCVPEECHGRAKRGPDFQCVLAPEKPEAAVSARFVGKPRPKYRTKNVNYPVSLGLYNSEKLSVSAIYEVDIEATFAYGFVPEEARFTLWLDELAYEIPPESTVFDDETIPTPIPVFRCSPLSFSMEREKLDAEIAAGTLEERTGANGEKIYTKTVEFSFGHDCVGYDISKRIHSRLAMLKGREPSEYEDGGATPNRFGEDFMRPVGHAYGAFTRMNLAYDLKGATVWHKSLPVDDDQEFYTTSTPECAPNPTQFFYEKGTVNLHGYYSQRKIATYDKILSFESRQYFDNRYEIGTTNLEIGKTEMKVKPQLTFAERVPVSFSWYLHNMTFKHRYSSGFSSPLWPWIVDDGIEEYDHRGATAGDYFAEAYRDRERPYLPTNLRAEFYMIPSQLSEEDRATITPIKVGARSLRLDDLEGADKPRDERPGTIGYYQYPHIFSPKEPVTDLAYIDIDKTARDRIIDYIDLVPDRDLASFDVFYCIHASAVSGAEKFQPLWQGDRATSYEFSFEGASSGTIYQGNQYVQGCKDRGELCERTDVPIFALEDEDWAQRPASNQPWRRRGCFVASTPIVVYIDRFLTPSLPVLNREIEGFSGRQENGNNTASGQNTNSNARMYSGGGVEPGTDFESADASVADNRSGGSGGRSIVDLSVGNERTLIGDSPTISFEVDGKMLSYSLFDPIGLTDVFTNPEEKVNGVKEWIVKRPEEAIKLQVAEKNPTFTLNPPFGKLEKSLNDTVFKGNKFLKAYATSYAGVPGLGLGFKFPPIPLQIGPFRGEITFTISAGFSVRLSLTYAFAPDDESELYPCSGKDEPCYIVHEPASFTDAIDTCRESGGELAEFSSGAEADAILASVIDSEMDGVADDFWIGAQLAYKHKNKQCAQTPWVQSCKEQSQTEFRSVTRDVAFASQSGLGGIVSYVNGAISLPLIDGERATPVGLSTTYPDYSGVFYDRSADDLDEASVTEQKVFVCRYEPVGGEMYFSLKTGVDVVTGAGFVLQGCTPSSDLGVCLSGSLNVVAAALSFVITKTERWLLENSELVSPTDGLSTVLRKRGDIGFSIPFSIHLFSGSIDLSFEVGGWFSVSWTLHAFEGWKLFETTLFEVKTPFSILYGDDF